MSHKNIIIIIIVALLVLVLGGLVYENQKKNVAKTASTLKKNSDFASADSSQSISGKIYYVSNKDGIFEIYYYDLSQKENKLIFKDADEDYKMTTLGSFAYLSQEYVVFQQKGSQGQLVVIKLADASSPAVIFDNFTLPESLAVSPDGQTIFYSRLQTVDGTKKYYLYQTTRDAQNLRQVFSSDQSIKNIVSNGNGDKVAFIQNNEKIVTLDLGNLQEKEIYHSGSKIYALSWHNDGNLVFTEAKDEKFSSGKILSCEADGNNIKKVLETEKSFPDSPMVSPDFLATAYSLKTFTENYSMNENGEINFTLIGDEIINKIGSGSFIIAWVK